MKEILSKWDVNSLLADSGVTFGLRTLAAFVAYFTFVLLARLLPPSDLGEYVFALSALWILVDLATLGLGFAATRFIPNAQVRGKLSEVSGYIRFTQRTVFGVALLVSLTLAGIFYSLESGMHPLRLELMTILCVSLPFAALTVANTYIARAFNWFVFASSLGVALRPVLFAGFLLSLYLVDHTAANARLFAWALVASIVLVALAQSILLSRKLGPLELPPALEQQPRRWLTTAVVLLLATVFTNYYLDIHVVLSGLFLPPDELAIFNAALRTLAIIGFGSAAIGIAVSPRIAALHAQQDFVGLRDLARKAIGVTLIASAAGLALLTLLGKPILNLFGSAYVAGYQALLVAALAQLLASFSTVLVPMVAMTGHHASLVKGLLFLLPIIVAAHAGLIGSYGMIGASAAFVLSALLWALWIIWLVQRHVGIRLFTRN